MTSLGSHWANLELVESTAWGDPVPFSDFPNNDWSDIASGAMYAQAYTTINDRQDGKFYPIYRNEQDLARIRARTRRFTSLSELTEAVGTALRVYTFGKGVEVSVNAVQGSQCPERLLSAVNKVVKRFCDHNSMQNSLDIEIQRRTVDDGEAMVTLTKDEMTPRSIVAEFIEADQLTEPRSANDPGFLEWVAQQHGVDCSSFEPSWMFGVLTTKRNTSRPLGYHVIYDGAGNDWDFYTPDQLVHAKRNVTRNAKRGLSDWLACIDRLPQQLKLARNMAHGGALQSAIAWVEESPAGTTQGQLDLIGNKDGQYQKPTNVGGGGGTRTQRQTTYGPGSILRPTPGRKYVPGPMGAERNEGFMVVEQMLERLCATRFLMPYYMISADASNNNFASSLVAESPFVKARESDQEFYGGTLTSMLWKVIKLAWRYGWLDLCGIPFDRLHEFIQVVVDFPQVATRDRTQLVDQLVKEVTVLGTTSIETAAVDLGRDYAEEKVKGAKPAAAEAAGNGDPTGITGQSDSDVDPSQPGELSNVSTLQFRRNVKAINEILRDFKAGTSSREHSKQLLLALGTPDARAEALLDAADESLGDGQSVDSGVDRLEESLSDSECCTAAPDWPESWENYP